MSALTGFVLVAERPTPKPGLRAPDLATVATEINELYEDTELVFPFRATSSNCIEGRLGPGADPLAAILLGTLAAGPELHWTVVADSKQRTDEPSADRRGGVQPRAGGRAVVRTGSDHEDRLLEDLLPALFDQLDELTERQRTVVRLALVDGLRQSQVAARLGVKRATVSISFERSHVGSLNRFVSALRRIMLGVEGATERGGETGAD